MTNVNALDLAVWETDFGPDESLALTRFRLGVEAQATLLDWSRAQSGRPAGQPAQVNLDGLSELLAWFVPEIAFMRRHDWDPLTQTRSLAAFIVGDAAVDATLRGRVRAAIGTWLTLLYPDKPPETRAAIAATAMNDASWVAFRVSTALMPTDGACPRPADSLLFDAVAAHALASLTGRDLRFRSGAQRLLVAKTAQSSAFQGVELVAFPPRQGQRGGLWSEVISLYTPTYPERGRLHVLARPSIRNWGPVTRWSGRGDPDRSLDVFMPVIDGPQSGGQRHTSFGFRAERGEVSSGGGRAPVIGRWPHKPDQKVFDIVRRLTGRAALAPDELIQPIVDQDGLWVLPRLGTVHGDDWLAGGTGISWPDRHDIAQSLDEAFVTAGFRAVEPMKRASVRLPLDKPFNVKDETGSWAARRQAVLKALQANGSPDGVLDLYVFQRMDDAPERVAAALVEHLGPPETATPEGLAWPDGLSVRLKAVNAGLLAEEIAWPDLTEAETQALKPAQKRALRDLNRSEAFDKAGLAMTETVRAARGGAATIGCAVLEMPAGLQGRSGDPFQFARRALAANALLPQVVLVEAETPSAATLRAKYGSAVADCFRMLGVLPVDDLPDGLLPAALTVVQRNSDRIAGVKRNGHAFPLAARTRDGRLECAIPDETGAPAWSPYAVTALRILKGDYGKFGRGRQEETIGRFETFFALALEDISRSGPSLVICEGETLTHKLSALANGSLVFDRLTIANRNLTPADLPGLRLIRTSPDPKRQPFYYHNTDNSWPSGLFAWGEAKRTYYGLKQKPITVSNAQHFGARVSRHAVMDPGVKPPKEGLGRVSSQMDEICIAFAQEGDDNLHLATLVHRLRGAHAQYDADTARPFPLHELRRLGGGITL